MYDCNKTLVRDILNGMPEGKKETLRKACYRNLLLTSSYGLEHCHFEVYKEGFRVVLDGCRSQFSVWVNDNDGELEYSRKPNASKLHMLYKEWTSTDNILDLYKF